MKRLGLSIYPELAGRQKTIEYIAIASKYNFKRLFLNLLELGDKKIEILSLYKDICNFAQELGYEVILDVNPLVFSELNLTPNSEECYQFFTSIGATGIRLDEDFGGKIEKDITFNKYNLILEINASAFTNIEDKMKKYGADMSKVIACHNFYPQQYTGLSTELFFSSSKKFKEIGMKVASFISLDSKRTDTIGPWKVNDGMPTLEILREKPLNYQLRYLVATDLIDDFIISAQPALEYELKELSKISLDGITFRPNIFTHATEIEKQIIFNHDHKIRGDYSDYMIRSTMPRITYKDISIPQRHCLKKTFEIGDIVILNNNYGRYKGELHIITKEIPYSGKRNYVGRLDNDDIELLKFKSPWKKFNFTK